MGTRIGLGAMREAAAWVTGQEYNRLALPYIRGRWYFVCPGYGDDGASGKTPLEALESFVEAEDRVTDGAGDGICLLSYGTTSADTTSYLTAAVTFDKSNVTVFGVCAPVPFAQRARIANDTATLTLASLMTVSGSNNRFINMSITNYGTNVAAVGGVIVSGSRNYFDNVHMLGGGHATPGIVVGANSLTLTGSENLFNRCEFGTDTFDRGDSAGGEIILSSGGARNRFVECETLTQRSAGTTAGAIKLGGSGDCITRDVVFERCRFLMYREGNVAAEASVVIGTSPNNGFILFDNCSRVGFTDWAGVATNRVFANNPVGHEAGGNFTVCNPS